MSWSDLSEWWLSEIVEDPAYEVVVTPMLLQALRPESDRSYLDLGAGEGRVMKAVAQEGAAVSGIDINVELAPRAMSFGSVVIGRLPDLDFMRDDSYDGAFCVLVIEHIDDHERLFRETGRVVRPGGVFALVMNHPTWTAPGSTPITDIDGETLWRPGGYFSRGTTEEPAGEARVVFHHRSMADLLNAAADAGWSLEDMTEAPHHDVAEQAGIPRLLACRWRLLP
ncbi:MAG: class I SAM-dependent methyltransferase [Acidimicrobiia bacterium]